MIATTTAPDLIDAVRGIVRAGRSAHHGSTDDWPTAPAALLGLLAGEGERRKGRSAEALTVDPSVLGTQVAI